MATKRKKQRANKKLSKLTKSCSKLPEMTKKFVKYDLWKQKNGGKT